jgi:hypothetical protein
VDERVENGANRQDSECDEQQRPILEQYARFNGFAVFVAFLRARARS